MTERQVLHADVLRVNPRYFQLKDSWVENARKDLSNISFKADVSTKKAASLRVLVSSFLCSNASAKIWCLGKSPAVQSVKCFRLQLLL